MAKLKISADVLSDLIMAGPNFVTINGATWDPIYRVVILDISGSSVPDVEEVTALVTLQRVELVPV
jgi:hypothetical protein